VCAVRSGILTYGTGRVCALAAPCNQSINRSIRPQNRRAPDMRTNLGVALFLSAYDAASVWVTARNATPRSLAWHFCRHGARRCPLCWQSNSKPHRNGLQNKRLHRWRCVPTPVAIEFGAPGRISKRPGQRGHTSGRPGDMQGFLYTAVRCTQPGTPMHESGDFPHVAALRTVGAEAKECQVAGTVSWLKMAHETDPSCSGCLGQRRHGFCLFAVCDLIRDGGHGEFLLARRVREAH